MGSMWGSLVILTFIPHNLPLSSCSHHIGQHFLPEWAEVESQLKSWFTQNELLDSPRTSHHLLPPKYMIELYHQQILDVITSPEDPRGNSLSLYPKLSQSTETKIRCILGRIRRREILSFNLTALTRTFSQISHAEIHFHRKRSHLGRGPRLKFMLAKPKKRRETAKKIFGRFQKLDPGRKGWDIIPVTTLIKVYGHNWEILSVSLEGLFPEFGSSRETYHNLPLDSYIRISYTPFLIVITTKETQDPIKKEPKSLRKDDGEVEHENNRIDNEMTMTMNYLSGENNRGWRWSRGRRALPYFDEDKRLLELNLTNGSIHQFPPQISQEEELNNQILNWTGSSTSRKRRRGNIWMTKGKTKKNFKKDQTDHFWTTTDIIPQRNINMISSCSLLQRSVGLQAKWAEQILSPATFPLTACLGGCNKSGNREAACMQSKVSPIIFLFVDKFETIVLKAFPNGTTTECSCQRGLG